MVTAGDHLLTTYSAKMGFWWKKHCAVLFKVSLFYTLLLSANAIYEDEPMVYGRFPPNFIWASATSAYQIEGGWDADGKGLSIWDVYVTDTSVIVDGSTGQIACDSYHLYQRDVEMLRSLNATHYRFSIAWTRLLPNGIGAVNQKGIDYYKKLIAALQEANIEPIVTLYHWDLPYALQQNGDGWMNPKSIDWFREYAHLCFTEFGEQVKWWITINEPWVVAVLNYGTGEGAPAMIGPGTNTYIVAHHLILAHATVYRMYQDEFKNRQQGKVGITLNIGWTEAHDSSPGNREAAERSLLFSAGWFADPIFLNGDYPGVMKLNIGEKSKQQGFPESRLPVFTEAEKLLVAKSADFMGLNHYSSSYSEDTTSDINDISYFADQDVRGFTDPTWYDSSTDWLKITPFGMYRLLDWIKNRYNNPEVMITENGISDSSGNLDDMTRVYYYKHYINQMLKAYQSGVNVIGYAAWSLMDNYEWNGGYTSKFGIFSVNFSSPDLTRTAKASAMYLARIFSDNGFLPPVDGVETCGIP